MQADTKFCDWHYYLGFCVSEAFFFPENIPSPFGLFATFRSVYYIAPTIIPYQMGLIQIVKIPD